MDLEGCKRARIKREDGFQVLEELKERLTATRKRRRFYATKKGSKPGLSKSQTAPKTISGLERGGDLEIFPSGLDAFPRTDGQYETPKDMGGNGEAVQDIAKGKRKGTTAAVSAIAVGTKHPPSAYGRDGALIIATKEPMAYQEADGAAMRAGNGFEGTQVLICIVDVGNVALALRGTHNTSWFSWRKT